MACLRIVLLTCLFLVVFVRGAGRSSKEESCSSSERQSNNDPEWILLQGNLVPQHDHFASASRALAAVDFIGDTDDVSDLQVEQFAHEVDGHIAMLKEELGGEMLDWSSLAKSSKSTRMSMAAAPRSNLVLNARDPDDELIELENSA